MTPFTLLISAIVKILKKMDSGSFKNCMHIKYIFLPSQGKKKKKTSQLKSLPLTVIYLLFCSRSVWWQRLWPLSLKGVG